MECKMSRYEQQLANQRANWKKTLKLAKCPKDGAKILEIEMPNVACSLCSTRYVLAVSTGGFLGIHLIHKLIEQEDRQETIIKEKEIIVKIRCSHCHNLRGESVNNCPQCGAHV